jgi:renalase
MVAVIGGGVAGLTCARALSAHGIRACVFDKGRRPGGRISTRRSEGQTYDHGAQYVTARDPRFIHLVNALQGEGIVAAWRGRFVEIANGAITPLMASESEWLVGVPGMSALAAALAADVHVVTGVQVVRIDRDAGGWTLVSSDEDTWGRFDAVIVAVPAPQAVLLLEAAAPRLAGAAAAVGFEPCWAAMVALEARAPANFDAAVIKGSALAWIARDGSKPGRMGGETWVLHAAGEWSAAHLEQSHEEVAEALLGAFANASGIGLGGIKELRAHRWRYARVTGPVGQPFLFDAERLIGACGDWCLGARIEAAFLSGRAMAERLVATLPTTQRS